MSVLLGCIHLLSMITYPETRLKLMFDLFYINQVLSEGFSRSVSVFVSLSCHILPEMDLKSVFYALAAVES